VWKALKLMTLIDYESNALSAELGWLEMSIRV
jgi:hypothetical protein